MHVNKLFENYSEIFKWSLGKNKYIHWINYIHFIKSESNRIKDKIYKNCNQNIIYRYLDTEYENVEDNKPCANNNEIKENENNIWLKNNHNSCRFVCSITI